MCSGLLSISSVIPRSALKRAEAIVEAAKIKDTETAFTLLMYIIPADLKDAEVVTKLREAERLFDLPPKDHYICFLFQRTLSGAS